MRNLRAAFTGGTALVARAVQVGTSLITIPLTIHYLGNERFGLWMSITSVLALANFADFGVGNGLLNAVADAYGRDDYDQIRRSVSSGFALLSAVGIFLFGLFVATFSWISWADVFRVTSSQARAEAGPALLVFAACFALNIPLDVVQRTQLGLQQGFRMNLWLVCGSVLGLAGVIAGIHLHAGLPVLVAMLAGAPVFVVALNSIHFFVISRPELCPQLRLVSRPAISQITTLGGFFFILQLVAGVSYSADNFIIARILGAASVPLYSIPQRMFSVISLAAATLLIPLWPAYGEAISRGDSPWVRRTLIRSLLIGVLATSVGALLLLFLGQRIISLWIGPGIVPSMMLMAGLALWTVVDCIGNAVAMFLNGASRMRFQVAIALVFGPVCLTLKVALTERFGVTGVPWATLLTHLALVELPMMIYVPRVLAHLGPQPKNVILATPVIED